MRKTITIRRGLLMLLLVALSLNRFQGQTKDNHSNEENYFTFERVAQTTRVSSLYIDKDVSYPNLLKEVVFSSNYSEEEYNLFTHGRAGELLIDGKWLNAKQIVEFIKQQFKTQSSTVKKINIFGCEFAKGKKGASAVAYLEETLDVAVAASTNITGKDGDWILEIGNHKKLEFQEYPDNLQDTDGDGIADATDIDDDNDGILDIVEKPISPFQFAGLSTTLDTYNINGATITQQFGNVPSVAGPNTDDDGNLAFASGGGAFVDLTVTYSNDFEILFSPATNASVNFDPNDRWRLEATGATFIVDDPLGELLIISNVTGSINFGPAIGTSNGTDWTIRVANASSIKVTMTAGNSASDLRVRLAQYPDTDGDGIQDYQDLDSDNDGISDLYESTGGVGDATADTNNDGTISIAEAEAILGVGNADADGDGLLDIFDADTGDIDATASAGNTPINSDGDGINDYLDLDSDGDGIPDTVEAQLTSGYTTNDGDVTNDDADGDGIIALFDSNDGGTATFGGSFTTPVNTDGTDNPDYLDTDSENDTLLDSAESGLTLSGTDANDDGIDDNASIGASYTDPDGVIDNPSTALDNQIGDTSEVGYREVGLDTDGDGVTDVDDIDDDNDGIRDVHELNCSNVSAAPIAGIDNLLGVNGQTAAINDGAITADQGAIMNAVGEYMVLDLGGVIPSGTTITVSVWENTNTSKTIRIAELTNNTFVSGGGTLLGTITEADVPSSPSVLSQGFTLSSDTQYVQIEMTVRATGRFEIVEVTVGAHVSCTGSEDSDGDAIINRLDLDSDNDGIADIYEHGNTTVAGYDTNGNGTIEASEGFVDDGSLANSTANNGLDDRIENLMGTADTGVTPVDSFNTAADNIADFLDLDSDDDGIPDATEARATANYIAYPATIDDAADSDDDGILDIFDDAVGFGSTLAGFKTGGRTPNADADDTLDNTPDFLDLDSDGDGNTDADESDLTTINEVAYGNPDGNANDPLSSSDGSILMENTDSDSSDVDFRSLNDTDGDGIPDTVDIDDDNDGILDADEAITGTQLIVNGTFDTDLSNWTANGVTHGSGLEGSFAEFPAFGTISQTVTINPNLTSVLNFSYLRDIQFGGDARGTIHVYIDGIFQGNFDVGENTYTFIPDSSSITIEFRYGTSSSDILQLDDVTLNQRSDLDSDSDGIVDRLDLDSDNDGIPDNIEAFTTQEYVVPSYAVGANGLHNNYDATGGDDDVNATSIVTLPNTDGTDNVDYLDLDSDNDNVFDIAESGLANNDGDSDGVTDGTVGANGLDNDAAIETADNYTDVNGLSHNGTNFLLADSDNDTDANGNNASPPHTDLDYRDFNTIVITQVYESGGNRVIELTNFDATTMSGGTIHLVLFSNTSGDQTGVTPSSTYTVVGSLAANQSVLIESSGFTGATINNSPLREVNTGVTNFEGGDDVLILSSTLDNTAWANRYDVVESFANTTSYVRNDEVSSGSGTFSSSEWTAFVDDSLDPYRAAGSGGPERHAHDPLISEVNTSAANTNMGLGYHRTGITSRTGSAWSNGEPDRSRRVSIDEDYNHTGSSISARQLTVTGDSKLSVTDNAIIVTDNITLTATGDEIRLVGTSQLITTHTNTTQISGDGKLYVDQNSDVPSLYRYNYFGTPVNSAGQVTYTLSDVMKDGTSPTSESSTAMDINFIGGFNGDGTTSPISLAEYWIYTYGATGAWAQRGSSGAIPQTDGFIFKGPGQAQNYTFVGTPKDGTLQTTVGASTSYLLGNPYASAIRASKFIEDNLVSTTGTLYFWEQKESANGEVDQSGHNFGGYVGGYAIRNIAMGIAANNVTGDDVSTGVGGLGSGPYKEPAEYIAIGQGFFVGGSATGGTIEFNNSQREYIIEGAQSVFFRNTQTETNDNPYGNLSALKLGMDYLKPDEELELHRQIGISFIEGNSFGYEKGYDSEAFDLGATDIYWDFPEDNTPYFIAGVGAIEDGMQIPLTFVMEHQGDIKLRIDEIGNINREVYLVDQVTQISYELTGESITLTLSPGTYSGRFYIAFGETLLNNDDQEILNDKVKIYADQENHELIIETNDFEVIPQELVLYDLLGKKIKQWGKLQEKDLTRPIRLKAQIGPTGIYFIKLKTQKGTVNKKVYLNFN